MQAAVFDTYVPTSQGGVMHFDILVPPGTPFEQVCTYGKHYLSGKGQANQPLSTKECQFCHIETATQEMEQSFSKQGYFIIEMEGCDISVG